MFYHILSFAIIDWQITDPSSFHDSRLNKLHPREGWGGGGGGNLMLLHISLSILGRVHTAKSAGGDGGGGGGGGGVNQKMPKFTAPSLQIVGAFRLH